MKHGIGKVEKNEHGFEIINFKDQYGVECSLQESSIMMEGGAVWLGCDKNCPPHLGHELSPRMHLTRDQVEKLVRSLKRWLNKGTFRQ